ncbi:hypothetical protein IFM89_013593 [Coptis chinensis]|uniref:Uncharacterized protein n=1 Tax=Coptis chinensis TaxID=261450 RepID=A0A835HEI2_9MAGN|nr:hypothetical protein IFM89_013593 [Coptis chinensis]
MSSSLASFNIFFFTFVFVEGDQLTKFEGFRQSLFQILGKALEFLRIVREFNMDPEENFNPNTEVDETLDSDMDPEENFNSNTKVDETPDSNMEENVTQRTGEKRKGRGAVVCSRLTKMKENERVDVVFNQNGQRIGEGGKDLASYSGLLAASRVSIATYDNWHDVKGEARDKLWKFIKEMLARLPGLEKEKILTRSLPDRKNPVANGFDSTSLLLSTSLLSLADSELQEEICSAN